MFKIERPIFTFISYKRTDDLDFFGKKHTFVKSDIISGPEWASVSKVRESLGYEVKSYIDLVRIIAEVGFRNNSYNLLYRGQTKDFKDRNNKTTLYPSIYRPERVRLSKKMLKTRFSKLNTSIEILRKSRSKINFHLGLSNFKEYQIALLQHYELAFTPFLDLTNSLLVAASFALRNSKQGYVYVLGMPHTQGSISFFVDSSLTIVKLQNVSPPDAIRPHFQSGFLVGRLPYTSKRHGYDNFAYRLICKIKCVDEDNKFWSKGFNIIPEHLLIPPEDEFQKKLKRILSTIT